MIALCFDAKSHGANIPDNIYYIVSLLLHYDCVCIHCSVHDVMTTH